MGISHNLKLRLDHPCDCNRFCGWSRVRDGKDLKPRTLSPSIPMIVSATEAQSEVQTHRSENTSSALIDSKRKSSSLSSIPPLGTMEISSLMSFFGLEPALLPECRCLGNPGNSIDPQVCPGIAVSRRSCPRYRAFAVCDPAIVAGFTPFGRKLRRAPELRSRFCR